MRRRREGGFLPWTDRYMHSSRTTLWGWCVLPETGLRVRIVAVAVAVVGLARVREYTSKPWSIKMSRSGSLAEGEKRGVWGFVSWKKGKRRRVSVREKLMDEKENVDDRVSGMRKGKKEEGMGEEDVKESKRGEGEEKRDKEGREGGSSRGESSRRAKRKKERKKGERTTKKVPEQQRQR